MTQWQVAEIKEEILKQKRRLPDDYYNPLFALKCTTEYSYKYGVYYPNIDKDLMKCVKGVEVVADFIRKKIPEVYNEETTKKFIKACARKVDTNSLKGAKTMAKSTRAAAKTTAKTTTRKTAATSKSTKSTKATKSKTDKKYSYAEVRALLKRALRSRRTVKKRGLGKSYNTRYAGRIEKGVYTYTLRNR